MSLVGTRPILQDELLKYELHHRARIAIKPGITGMWQVSGRSDITDFEEVVRLDTEYIGIQKKIYMAKYANPVVLILDEWLLLKPTESEQRDIFELLHRRRKKSSTIFCSQYEFEEWYDQLGGDDSPLADAIIDRIAHDSYRINITSIDAEHDISMREVYGLDKTLRE